MSGPLPSWTDGAAKSAILDFVARVTTEGGPEFVPPTERIATFENDGTLDFAYDASSAGWRKCRPALLPIPPERRHSSSLQMP